MANILDIDALVQPIPGDNPGGEPLPDMLRFELDELRKDADPLDPGTAGRRADWNKIIRICSETLSEKSKDYLVAARLLEAVTRKHGIPGLKEGLALMVRLTQECWDYIHPMPGEGETMDVREGPFKWLNDVSRGARFPQAISECAIARSSGRGYSYIDWIVPEKKGEFEENIPRIESASLKKNYTDLQDAYQLLKEFAAALDEKMGSEVAPDFLSEENTSNIGTAFTRCIELVEQLAKQRGVALVDAPQESESENAESSGSEAGESNSDSGVASHGNAPQTREGLYGQISRIALSLRRLEPHSPIPYMLERCVRLGSLPFPDLMRAMVREVAALDELDRLIGVEKPSGGE